MNMDDFTSLEKSIVRELSCRLCLCSDVVKLKPLSAEVKRKIKKLFDIVIRGDDTLPKAICHDCLQQVSNLHLYAVKVEKTQKFLDFHRIKAIEEKRNQEPNKSPVAAITAASLLQVDDGKKSPRKSTKTKSPPPKSPPPRETQQGDTKTQKNQVLNKQKKKLPDSKFLEAMPLDEFAHIENVDKSLLKSAVRLNKSPTLNASKGCNIQEGTNKSDSDEYKEDSLDPLVLIDGRPARQGAALDKQITLFYKMECCICHENGFHFRSLMKHYKDRHGVPGYVTCCNKKFHYFYPKKIIEHMAYHLQPNIFMCPSCHTNFPSSQELHEHRIHGGRSEGKILCPRCSERFPTYRELGTHLISHRADKNQCDYCGKQLKHRHRKKTINHMEDVILCSHCIRTLRTIERHERDTKERGKSQSHDTIASSRHHNVKHAVNSYSVEEEASTD